MIAIIARVVLGVIFLLSGLTYFIGLFPTVDSQQGQFLLSELADLGYFFPVVKAIETLAGLLLLGNILVPLALLLLAPIMTHMFLFHLFVEPYGLLFASILMTLEIYLIYSYRINFLPLIHLRNRTTSQVRLPFQNQSAVRALLL